MEESQRPAVAATPTTQTDYERPLRLGAASLISLAFTALLTLFVIGFTFYIFTGTRDRASLLTDGALCASIALFIGSVMAARFNRLNMSTAGTILATNLTIITFMTFWAFSAHHYFDTITLIQFVSLSIAIVLAGALGSWWLVVATTLFVNGFSIWLILTLGQQTPLPQSVGFFMLIAIMQQWTVAALAVTISGFYRRILNDLGQAYAQAQQLNALKDQFITHVNHELRTPIMTLHGYVEFLQMMRGSMSPEDTANALDKASCAGYNLISLLNSILDVRRIDVNDDSIPTEIVPLRRVLDEALSLVDPRDGTNTSMVQINVPSDLAVVGDRVRVQQILTNLVSNAFKYAPDAPILISAEADTIRLQERSTLLPWRIKRRSLQVVTMRVRDYGPGVPPEQLDLLFNRFVRLPRDLASNVVGNGLGLYLCRVFATSMKGRIWAESDGKPGEGTTFMLQLPAASAIAASFDKESTQPRLRVLA